MKDTGGPAFPQTRTLPCGSHEECEGMTLRDYFAAKALPMAYDHWRRDLEGNPNDHNMAWYPSTDTFAEAAYALADSMLEERKK